MKIKSLLAFVCLVVLGSQIFAQTKSEPSYIGNWSNGRAFQMFIENGTIRFESKGNKTQTFMFRDVTTLDNGVYMLEITNPTKESYFSRFLSLSVKTDESSKLDELTMTNYNSLADMKAGKNQQGNDFWIRDGVEVEEPVDLTAGQIVKDLFAAHAADKGPFFQAENRELVDRFFSKDLADMIWKDSVDAEGEVGAIDFDPLFYSQDPGESDIRFEEPKSAGGTEFAMIEVNFKSHGKPQKVDFEVARGEDKIWKISQIYYADGEDLKSILNYSQNEDIRKEYDAHTFKGTYLVGKVKCTATPTLSGYSTRVECENREGFRLYSADGTATEDIYLDVDESGNELGKFVFKGKSRSGVFIDAKGKSVKVVPVK